MQAGLSPARHARAQHRHELRTLTYVTIDQANGGIVRNVTHEGIGVQAVAALRPQQQVRVRFELRHPRLRVETRGEVVWATLSGQCGIRFLDLPPRMTRQINEWIFGSLLEGSTLHAERTESMFEESGFVQTAFAKSAVAEVDDGLVVSGAPVKVIQLPMRVESSGGAHSSADAVSRPGVELDWLSQPLSGRTLAWTINTLVVVAAVLLFALVFLSVTREPPRWPVAMALGAAGFVAGFYWGFFKLIGGASLGARLARLAGADAEEDEETKDARFR